MKILVVDDIPNFVKFTTERMRNAGLDADGIVTARGMMTPDGKPLGMEDVLALVRSANVIFLDHNMPGKNGKELLEHWQLQGVDFASKRVVGTSSGSQPYLKEQFSGLGDANRVKLFLGI